MAITRVGAKRLQGLKSDRVSDSLGSSADGVNTNVTLDTTNEKLGTGCYNFDGSGDKTALGTSTTFSSTLTDGSTDWTIAFWMKLNATEPNGNNAIFCQGQGNEQGLDILFDDRSAESRDHVLGVRMEGVGGHTPLKLYTGASFIPKDTNWHHYVITADISTRTITAYRDNANAVSDSTGSGSFPSASDLDAPMTFGVHPSGGFGDLNAKLDDCGIWSRILTSDERTSLWNSGDGNLANTISGGLVAYYSFDSTSLDLPTPTFEDDFSGSNTWTSDGTDVAVNASTDVIDWDSDQSSSGQDQLYKDLTTVSDTKWFVDFDITFTTVGASGSSTNGIFLLVVLDSITADANTVGHDALGIAYEVDNTPTNQASIEAFSCDDKNLYDAMEMNTPTGTVSLFNETAQASETQYIRMVRDGSTFTVHLYSSSARTGTPIESEEVDATDGGTVSGLRYLKIMTSRDNTGDHEFVGTIDNVKFYNDTATTGCQNNASATSNLDALTGVRTNTIFEETDASATNISDLTSSMILQYNFDETSGVTLNDQVGSVDGELKDGSLVNVDGVVGKGWRFDDTKVQIDQSLGTVSSVALSIWVKKFDGNRCPIAIDSSTSNFGNGLWFEDAVGSLGLRIGHQAGSNGTDCNTTTSIPQDGEFHHVVFNAWSGGSEIYLDGTLLPNSNTSSHDSGDAYGGALELAYNGGSSPSVYGNCALDEARWFNKRLSQEEVTALYNNPDKFYWWYDGTNWVVGD